jgi:hypothetical protein
MGWDDLGLGMPLNGLALWWTGADVDCAGSGLGFPCARLALR